MAGEMAGKRRREEEESERREEEEEEGLGVSSGDRAGGPALAEDIMDPMDDEDQVNSFSAYVRHVRCPVLTAVLPGGRHIRRRAR